MRVLITTGPTQEPIDDVRYITNASSGKMGAAVALEAMGRGHDVTLVHGPVSITVTGNARPCASNTRVMPTFFPSNSVSALTLASPS